MGVFTSYEMRKGVIILLLVILFTSFIKTTDGFRNNSNWSPELIKRFNIYQSTMNQNKTNFNLDLLQKQASPYEVNQLLQTGFWPWPDDLKNGYIEKVQTNTIIKIDPQYALNYAMRIYNQTAARELLAWNTKEGHFLLYGGDLGVSDGMPQNVHNTIKCSTDSNMEKKIYTKMNLWNGFMNNTTTTISPEDIPNEMPGFSFVKSPCNPCIALNSPGDFSCPFRLNVNGNNSISNTWSNLWQL